MQIQKILLFMIFIFVPTFVAAQTLTKIVSCPPVSALSKDPIKKTWSAPGGFKSYDLSFVTNVKNFLGAQWRGATVGQVTCVYKGDPKNSFNVLLVYNTLAFEPADGAWGNNLGGYRNCISRKQKRCVFSVAVKGKSGNIYQDIENYKS